MAVPRTSRIKPDIRECLSPWADRHDAADLLERFAAEIARLAERQNTRLLDYPPVLKALGLKSEVELASLGVDFPAAGVVRLGGHWTLDARQFGLWAQGQLSVMRREPRRERTDGRALY